MSVILNLVAVALGVAAFYSGPDNAPGRMVAFGVAAAVCFGAALSMSTPDRVPDLHCTRYSSFAESC